MTTTGRKITCGIIGLGWWGGHMATEIAKSNEYEIISVYDFQMHRSDEFARKHNTIAAESMSDLVSNAKIECIFIFTPNEHHLEHVAMAAKAKKHVFLEKPIANSSKDGEQIISICARNEVTLAIGHNVRYYNIFKAVKRLLEDGSIGHLVYLDCNRSRPIGFDIAEDSWRFHAHSCTGGPLIQMAIHLIDTIQFLTNDPPSRIKSISQKRLLSTENAESYAVSMESRLGVLMNVFCSYVAQETFYINLFGTEGSIFADPFNGLFVQGKGEFHKVEIKVPDNNPEADELREFHGAICEGREYSNPHPRDALECVKIIEKILGSVEIQD